MAENIVVITVPLEKPIKIFKWKVKEGALVSQGQIILLYHVDSDCKEVRRFKCPKAGTVKSLKLKEGDTAEPGAELVELSPCQHPTVMKEMCAECGADLRTDDAPLAHRSAAIVPMIHSVPELKVSEELAQKLGRADNERLLRDRKLVLLVDLDQTLVHTTNENVPPNLKGVHHFRLNTVGVASRWYHTRLRPGTERFLQAAQKHYELHVCTFGARQYAHAVSSLLDPRGHYFSHRILSRDECFDARTKAANLKALFPCGDELVCIIDDREDVWRHASNLIQVRPYHFFEHTGDINAPIGDQPENKAKNKYSIKKNGSQNILTEMPLLDTDVDIDKPPEDNGSLLKKSADSSKIANMKQKKKSQNENNVSKKAYDNSQENKKETKINDNLVLPQSPANENHIVHKDEAIMKPCLEEHEQNNDSESIKEASEKNNTRSENLENTDEISDKIHNHNLKSETGNEEVKNIIKNVNEVKDGSVSNDNNDESAAISTECDDNVLDVDEYSSESSNVETKISSRWHETPDGLLEIEDSDDYLIYLEDILQRIHKFFYEQYDKMEAGKVPDLKRVIPEVRAQVLAGRSLVFSGLVPTNQRLESSRAYHVARSLGAEVTADFTDRTTHLVAVRPGTAKVNVGRKLAQTGGKEGPRRRALHVVTPAWLWGCAERWEHVDERMYPLQRGVQPGARKPPAHCNSPPPGPVPAVRHRTPSGRFMDTLNPLLSFSSDDIADMDREVEDIFNESDDEADAVEDEAAVEADRLASDKSEPQVPIDRLGGGLDAAGRNSSSDSLDSLSGGQVERKRRRRHSGSSSSSVADSEPDAEQEPSPPKVKKLKKTSTDRLRLGDDDSSMDELPSVRFRRGGNLPSDATDTTRSDDLDDDDDNDCEWNMMGAALEREFLGLDE